jgi:hypothetical protein
MNQSKSSINEEHSDVNLENNKDINENIFDKVLEGDNLTIKDNSY